MCLYNQEDNILISNNLKGATDNLRVKFPLKSSLVILKYTISNLPWNNKKIAGDCGAVDFFYASAFPNACEENLAGE